MGKEERKKDRKPYIEQQERTNAVEHRGKMKKEKQKKQEIISKFTN